MAFFDRKNFSLPQNYALHLKSEKFQNPKIYSIIFFHSENNEKEKTAASILKTTKRLTHTYKHSLRNLNRMVIIMLNFNYQFG